MKKEELLINAIKELKNNTNISADFINFYEKIQLEFLKNSDKIAIDEELIKNIELDFDKKINNKQPVINIKDIIPDNDVLITLFNSYIKIIIENNEKKSNEAIKIKSFLENEKITVKDLLDAFININSKFDEKISKAEIDIELLSYLLKLLVVSIISKYANELKGKITDKHEYTGNCPICGQLAAMSKFENETGSRKLWCSYCNSEWPFKRITCVHCGNQNHDQLGYFTIEDKSPYRVDYCEKCGKYIKSVDERRIKEGTSAVMSISEIASIDLDLLAEKEGYKPI